MAYEVAKHLGAPLDVFVVRKLGVPGHEELAMGALASGGMVIANPEVMSLLRIDEETFDAAARREQQELARREHAYRGDRAPPDLEGKVVIVVDDGLATGTSMRAAVAALRHRWPARIVVAVPVAAPSTCEAVGASPDVDEIVCLQTPEPFFAVGLWYHDFRQTSDEEVRDLLDEAAREHEPRDRPYDPAAHI